MSFIQQMKASEIIDSEPWPEDATLYQPYEAEQILLPENASCLAVKAFLKMCKLKFEIRTCANAEFMSPGGRMTKLPFLKANAFIFAEFEPIVSYVEQKALSIGKHLDEDEKADMRTYVSLVEHIFTMAEIYISFVNEEVYQKVTAPRNAIVFPWPLGLWQNFTKRRNALRLLKVYQWNNLTIDNVIEKVEKCCDTLTMKLQETVSPYFYGNEPCELDAIVFGHLFCVLTTALPQMALAQTVNRYPRLVDFCTFINKTYFPNEKALG